MQSTSVKHALAPAGALNQLDRADQLPTAYSGHMHYHFWSEEADFSDVIAVGFDETELRSLYKQVEVLEVFECERCMSRENGLIIARARIPAVDSEAIRRLIKRFYFF